MALRVPVVGLAPLLLSGCALVEPEFVDELPPPRPASVELLAEDPVPIDWGAVVTDDDKDRLSRVDDAWAAALAEAEAARFARAIRDEGRLLDPAAALPRAALPPGPYLCRTIKLGSQSEGGLPFAAYRPFNCYVEAEGALLTLVKQSGSQRPAGRLWAERDDRMIFLGGLALGDEEGAPPYGADSERDVAGVVERVEPFRWRLVLPWPRTESKLDVIELIPIPPEMLFE